MEREKFEKILENYKEKKEYSKINEFLEKQIIYFYYKKLIMKLGKFTFRNRLRMLEEMEKNLDIEDCVNFRKFFKVTSNYELSEKDLFEELETIYYDMY